MLNLSVDRESTSYRESQDQDQPWTQDLAPYTEVSQSS